VTNGNCPRALLWFGAGGWGFQEKGKSLTPGPVKRGRGFLEPADKNFLSIRKESERWGRNKNRFVESGGREGPTAHLIVQCGSRLGDCKGERSGLGRAIEQSEYGSQGPFLCGVAGGYEPEGQSVASGESNLDKRRAGPRL